jgi:hypothetical protein
LGVLLSSENLEHWRTLLALYASEQQDRSPQQKQQLQPMPTCSHVPSGTVTEQQTALSACDTVLLRVLMWAALRRKLQIAAAMLLLCVCPAGCSE